MNPIYDFGISIIQALQTMSPALDGIMQLFTTLGRIEFYLLLIPLIYWLIDAQLGVRVFLLLIFTDFLGMSVKLLLHQPRPYWIGSVDEKGVETSYGFPSTHASDSLAVWGYLAYRLRKGWLWGLSCLAILLIGISRIYLAVHFPTDVLGGWLIGLTAIVLFVVGERSLLPWFKQQTQAVMIAVAFGTSVVMILVGQLILALIASYPDPVSWAQSSAEARTPAYTFTVGGALFGATAGYVLMLNHARFHVKTAWWQCLACYLIGVAGVLLIYFGLDILFSLIAADETTLGYTLRYIRYGAVAFWAMFGAPWVFLKTGLADPVKNLIATTGLERSLA